MPTFIAKVVIVLGVAGAIGVTHAFLNGPLLLRAKEPEKGTPTPGPKPVPYVPELDNILPGNGDAGSEAADGQSGEGTIPGDLATEPVAPTDTGAQPHAPPPTPAAEGPAAEVDLASLGRDVTLAEAHAVYTKEARQGLAQFIDARPPEEYQAGHIAGSTNIVPNNFRNGTPQKVKNYLDPSQRIVVYCSGGDCDASHQVARFMSLAGFDRVHIFTEGFDAWQVAHSKDVQRGADPFGG